MGKVIRSMREYADAHGDLNVAGGLIAMCEHSLFRTKAGMRLERRIVKMCKAHNQQQLRAMDRAEDRVARLALRGPEAGGGA